MNELIVKSSAFQNNGNIPSKYTCDSEDVNPPLIIEAVPKGAESLVLIVDDPDAPMGTWDHWIVWDIPPTREIAENSVPGKEGINSFNRTAYGGPCPPSGTHRYFFKVYALDKKLDLSSSARKKDVIEAMKNHVIAKGQLIGLYSRH